METNRNSPAFGWLPVYLSMLIGLLVGLAQGSSLLGFAAGFSGLLICVLADEIIITVKEGRP